jgi:hypothetical protein
VRAAAAARDSNAAFDATASARAQVKNASAAARRRTTSSSSS